MEKIFQAVSQVRPETKASSTPAKETPDYSKDKKIQT